VALLAASALCVATVAFREHHSGSDFYRFLIWNLALAWVPLLLALAAYASAQRGARFATVAFGVLWLLFFPNAPYLLTDFIHLRETPATPLWYDALLLAAFAWTGLLLGFASLYLMQMIWERAVGPLSWLGVIAALALASFGVYVGRFLRFNSWDALVRPRRLAQVIHANLDNPLQHPRLIASLIVLTASLTIGYLIVYSAAGAHLELDRD
jgi:uncharacterized membrane protein